MKNNPSIRTATWAGTKDFVRNDSSAFAGILLISKEVLNHVLVMRHGAANIRVQLQRSQNSDSQHND